MTVSVLQRLIKYLLLLGLFVVFSASARQWSSVASYSLQANEFRALSLSKSNHDVDIAIFKDEQLVHVQNSVLDFNHAEFLVLGDEQQGADWSIRVPSEYAGFFSSQDFQASGLTLEETRTLQQLSIDWHQGDLQRFSEQFEQWQSQPNPPPSLTPFQQQLLLHVGTYLHKTEQHKHTLSVFEQSGFPKQQLHSDFDIHANQLLAQAYLELNQFDDALPAYQSVNSHPIMQQLAWSAFSANSLSATGLINVLGIRDCAAPESEQGLLQIYQGQDVASQLDNALLTARITNRLWSYLAICGRFYDAELLIEQALQDKIGRAHV